MAAGGERVVKGVPLGGRMWPKRSIYVVKRVFAIFGDHPVAGIPIARQMIAHPLRWPGQISRVDPLGFERAVPPRAIRAQHMAGRGQEEILAVVREVRRAGVL